MNVLCQLLWDKSGMVSVNEIGAVWKDYVKTQRHMISHDSIELSPNQRKIITGIAQTSTKEIQSSRFTAPIMISASSAQQSHEVLMRNDLVYKNKEGYYSVLDPAMKYYCTEILWDDV
jgi:hypothetical protein